MNIGIRLLYLIEEESITQKKLADDLHLAPSTLNGYIKKGKEPDFHTLVRLANYFHTSIDYLLGHCNIRTQLSNALNDDEGALLGLYRLLSKQEQLMLREQAKLYYRLNHGNSSKSQDTE